jgi:aminoglycoside 3-N-acetyltransferase
MSWLGRVRFRLWGAYVARFRRYDAARFASVLQRLGVRPGDALMVHAALRPDSGYTGTPAQMIAALKAAVGEQGLLVMPSMTYSDSTQAFLLRGEPVRQRTSASRMGLLSEVFRRGKGVLRSLNPAHPLLAWGEGAAGFVAGHEQVDRSFGDGSPFGRLLERKAKLLCIEAPLESITYTHFLEDRHRERLPLALYHPQPIDGVIIDAAGVPHTVPTRVLSDASRQRRDEQPLWQLARRRGVVHELRVGNTTLRLLACTELTALFDAEFEAGRHWFTAA